MKIVLQYRRKLSCRDALKDLEEATSNALCQFDRPAQERPTGASLSVHLVHTKILKTEKRMRLEDPPKTAAFVIAVKGQAPNVVLPEIHYQDPVTIWRSRTSIAGTELANSIESQWEKTRQSCIEKRLAKFSGEMAEYSVFLNSDSPTRFTALEMEMKKDTVRKCKPETKRKQTKEKRESSCEVEGLIDIWSHNRRINGLHNHILEAGGKKKLDGLLNGGQAIAMSDVVVTNFIQEHQLHNQQQLPTSFKYPTIQIKLNTLPLVNQVGEEVDSNNNPHGEMSIKGCVVRENDNRAHLRVSKLGESAVVFDPKKNIKELVEYHRDFLQPKEKKQAAARTQQPKRPNSKPLSANHRSKRQKHHK